MTPQERSYTLREVSMSPYNRTVEMSREEMTASGLVLPYGIALLSYDQDPDKLIVPEGISLPDPATVHGLVSERNYDRPQPRYDYYRNLNELNDPLTRFVASALTDGVNFSLSYSDHADDDEQAFLRALAHTSTEDDTNYGGGMYL